MLRIDNAESIPGFCLHRGSLRVSTMNHQSCHASCLSNCQASLCRRFEPPPVTVSSVCSQLQAASRLCRRLMSLPDCDEQTLFSAGHSVPFRLLSQTLPYYLRDGTHTKQTGFKQSVSSNVNLQAPCVLYIGQAFRYFPENTFYIFNREIYFII